MSVAPSPAACPRCATPREAESRFCGRCGQRFTDPAPPSPPTVAATPQARAEFRQPVVTAPQFPVSAPPAPAAEAPRPAPAGRARTPALAADGKDPLVGRLIDGRYRVVDRLGGGGMGTVYRAVHERMQKVVALKVLHPHLGADKMVRARFHREARAASLLSSRNTVAVFDFGESPDGLLYLAMEYLKGRTLSALIRDRGVLSPARSARILGQVLHSLEEAHAQGIVHRDMKPDNIFLVDGDEPDLVKVLDFGIAKGERLSEGGAAVTRSDLVVGTPEYMAPEQARGVGVDARADLWGVGVMLHEAMTGNLPFTGPTPVDVLISVMEREPATPPDGSVPPAFLRVLARALRKKPVDRFQSATEMRAALAAAADTLSAVPAGNTPPGSVPPSPPQPDTLDELGAVDREEWSQFESSQQVRRWLGLAVGVALMGAVSAGAWALLAAPDAVTVEREPNDQAAEANLVRPESVVRGALGVPRAGRADEDLYVLDLPPGPHVLAVGVEPAVAGVRVGLTVWVDGRLVTGGFGKRLPHPRVRNLGVEGGRATLRVREENAISAAPPYPQAVDYRLEVGALRALTAAEEREPNETVAMASVVPAGGRVNAYLFPADEEDWFRLPAVEEGELGVEVVPAADLALEVALVAADGRRVARRDGRAGETVRVEVSARRCGVPCHAVVTAQGKTVPAQPTYVLGVR
ncbi:MAG: protein kinase [Deltaproteobacteria bacterium]|nr:protein kinase [Deltaproteobacteria bacterium]